MSDVDSSPLANDVMQKKIDRLAKAMDKADFATIRAVVDEMNDVCVNQRTIEKAKVDLAELIKKYAEVFNVEVKRRVAIGEYVPKQIVINDYKLFFGIVCKYIKEENVETVRQELSRYLISNSGFGAEPLEATNGK